MQLTLTYAFKIGEAVVLAPIRYLSVPGAIFVGLWLVNAMGILVDGSGGPIAYDGEPITEYGEHTDWQVVTVLESGDIYPCDKDIQQSGCKNSLTPFSGENGATSMPAGFHWDGIMFMILGLVGLGGIAYLQMQIKEMRDSHRREKKEDSNDGGSEADAEDSDDDESDDSDDDSADEDDDAD